jgi:two-component system cell cycle response regulator
MKVLISTGEALLGKTLTRWGYEVSVASDGPHALDLLTQDNPIKLAILNYEMQGLPAADLCARLRAGVQEPYIYLILLMEKCPKDELLQAFEQGADDYLAKPIDGYELRAKLLVAKRILALQDRLLTLRDELRLQAKVDALTGLWNRRGSMEELARELSRADRENRPVGLMLADLDHFKQVNDTYGHLTGDRVLKTVGMRLKGALRAYDIVGRYGGEEFLIVCPGCAEKTLLRRAEELRAAIAGEPVPTPEGALSVTLSLGAAVAHKTVPQDQLLQAADEALYKAKRAGRNRVEFAR